ncbi:unnamed protein product, partial [Laminaria digitata]
PQQTILIDSFPGNPYSDLIQPVWCSYLMGARGVTVISPNGKIYFQRGWFNSEHTARAIDKYWCEQLAGAEAVQAGEGRGEEGEEKGEGEGEGARGAQQEQGGDQFAQLMPGQRKAAGAAGAAVGSRGDERRRLVGGGGPASVDASAGTAGPAGAGSAGKAGPAGAGSAAGA